MGQIIGSAAKPKRCNISKLSQLGTPAAGEYILVSSDNSMNSAGQGNFDCYIVGNGTTAATELELHKTNEVDGINRTVTFQVVAGNTGQTAIIYGSFPSGVYGITVENVDTTNSGTFAISFTPNSIIGYNQSCTIGLERAVVFTEKIKKIQITDISSSISSSGTMRIVLRKLDDIEGQIGFLNPVGIDFSKRLKSPLVNGSLTNGAYNTYRARYRVYMVEFGQYDRDITITAKDGYKFFVSLYDQNGTFESATGWVTSYFVQSGKKFKICISTTNDNIDMSSELAAENIVITTLLENVMQGDDVVLSGHLLAGTVEVVNGVWTYRNYMSSSRVCVNPQTPITLKKGSTFVVPSNYQIFIVYRVNSSYYSVGSWLSGVYTCPEDGDYVFTYRKNPEEAFTEPTLEERVATLTINSADAKATNEKLNEVAAKIEYNVGKAKNIISVARLGYMPSSAATPPEQSIASYTEAYKHGYRHMLADVQWTSDGVPVALHDESINAVARNSDGTTISGTVDLSSHTLAEIDAYDFGIIKGEVYAGLKIMRIADFVRWCKIMNCIPILEIKDTITGQDDARLLSLVAILKQYGMARDVIFESDAGYNTSRFLHDAFPHAAIGRTVVKTTDFEGSILTETLNVKGDNRVFWALYLANEMTGVVSNTMLNVAFENDIDIYCTEIPNYTSFQNFISDDNNLACRYVAITGGTWDSYMNELNL